MFDTNIMYICKQVRCSTLGISSPLFLRLPEGKVIDPNKPYIGTSQTKIRNVCLLVVFEFCMLLWSVTRPQPTPLTRLAENKKVE